MLSNIEEVRARGAQTIAVATEGNGRVEGVAEETILIPRTDWVLQPLLAIIPLQLLAYHVARLNGLNVDQPRNLAKTCGRIILRWYSQRGRLMPTMIKKTMLAQSRPPAQSCRILRLVAVRRSDSTGSSEQVRARTPLLRGGCHGSPHR
jgi:hypothetical protein